MNTSIKRFTREAERNDREGASRMVDELESRLASVDEAYVKAGVRADMKDIKGRLTLGDRWGATKKFVEIVNTLDYLANGSGLIDG